MEIVIRTEAGEQASLQGAALQPTFQQSAAPPADVAAKADATGAINAGPAHIPAGATGEPIPDVVAAVYAQPGANGGDGMSAGSAAGNAEETQATMVEDGE
jgi:hypothetical protein